MQLFIGCGMLLDSWVYRLIPPSSKLPAGLRHLIEADVKEELPCPRPGIIFPHRTPPSKV